MTLSELLASLLLAVLPWVGLWTVLFCTPLIPHLLELLVTHEPMSTEDVETFLVSHNAMSLLTLYLCTWCQGFWVSVGAGVTYGLLFSYPPVIPIHILEIYPLTMMLLWTLKRLPNH